MVSQKNKLIKGYYMIIKCDKCILRKWNDSDLESLIKNANNPKIACNMRDGFPYPYTINKGKEWLEFANKDNFNYNFAITINDNAIGGIGLAIGEDIERISAEVGYWLGEDYWGCGITSSALKGIVEYGFGELKLSKSDDFDTCKTKDFRTLHRIFAKPLEKNIASRRVLEKNGFILEGILRKSVIKFDKIHNQALYSVIKE